MKKILVSFLILIFYTSLLSANSVFYLSVRGTWDKTKDNTRAQYAGNNKLLYKHFEATSRVFYGLGEINDICKATFTVTEKGTVENIKIVDGINGNYNTLIIQSIKATSGKWRPGIKNEKRESEEITIWIDIYNGKMIKKSFTECLQNGSELIEKKQYKKAIKILDIALTYNRFSIKAIELKISALKGLNEDKEVCKILKDNNKYYSEKIEYLLDKNCKK